MQIIDSSDLLPGTVIEADLCIVGTGPAGLTIARELAPLSARRRIVLVESGGLEPDPWADALGEIESVGARRVMDQTLVRNRVIGGTSSTWSGRAATFDENDFAARDWVPDSGWPISRAEVAGYFARSMDHLGLRIEDNIAPEVTARLPAALRSLDPAKLQGYLWSYSRDPSDRGDFLRFGRRALTERRSDIRLITHATVTDIETDAAASRTTGVTVSGPSGRSHRVTAPIVVLCAGAIENARLLLTSDRVDPAGLGNGHDLVGRYLMDHPRGPIARFAAADHLAVQRLFRGRRIDAGAGRTTVTVGMALSRDLQEREGLLNSSAWVSRSVAASDPIAALSAIARRDGALLSRAFEVARGAGLLVEGAFGYAADGSSPLRLVDELSLECMVEQRPDRDSRVTLSSSRDALGMRTSRIDWRVSDQEAATVRRMGEVIVSELRRLGLPAPRLADDIVDDDGLLTLPDVAHPSGTTRMSTSPATGVVDTDSRVHGVEGLFVAGSSVFPTSGHANPTQMIVALAVRLADHLGGLLEPRQRRDRATSSVSNSPSTE